MRFVENDKRTPATVDIKLQLCNLFQFFDKLIVGKRLQNFQSVMYAVSFNLTFELLVNIICIFQNERNISIKVNKNCYFF